MWRLQTAFAGVVALLAFMAVAAQDAKADALVVEGPAQVLDSMTLQIWGKRIRLAGITTLTPDKEIAEAAKAYLEQLVADVRVRCETTGADYRLETPGSCFVGSVDIGASLVRAGHARRIVQQSLEPGSGLTGVPPQK